MSHSICERCGQSTAHGSHCADCKNAADDRDDDLADEPLGGLAMLFPLLFLTSVAGYSLATGLSMTGWGFLALLWIYALVEVVSGILEVRDR